MDAFAAWCRVLRERGEVMDNHFGFSDRVDGLSRTWRIPHEEIDGARGIPRLLGEMGMPVPPIPRSREARPPGPVARAAALLRELREPSYAPVPWRRFDPNAAAPAEPRVAHAFFDRDATAAIDARARAAGATTNSFLLWTLDRAVYPEVAHPSPAHRWSIAVSMLGAARGADAMGTAATLVGVLILADATAADVRVAIGERLRANAHWGSWDALRLLGAAGEGAMRRYAARYYARERHSWVGGFSNVGAWDVDAGYWYAVQPVTRAQPIGAAAVTVGGRLGLAMQVHAVLAGVDARALMARWRAVLERENAG